MKHLSFALTSFFFAWQLNSQALEFKTYLNTVTNQLSKSASTPEHFRPPVIKSIQLRTETDEFVLDRQRVAIRLSPQPYGLGKIQTDLSKNMQQLTTIKDEDYFASTLKNYVEQWMHQMLNQLVRQEIEEIKKVLEDKKLIYQRLAQQSVDDLDNFLEVQHDAYDLDQKYINLTSQQTSVRELWRTSLGLPDTNSLSTEKLDVAVIQLLVNTDSLWNKIAVECGKEWDLRQNSIELEIAAEKVRKNNPLDFIQMQYQGPSQNLWEEKISLGLGLNLPLWGNNKIDYHELKLKQHELQRAQLYELNEVSLEVNRIKSKINAAINTHEVITLQKEEMLQLTYQLRNQPSGELSPLLVLSQNHEMHKFTIRQYDIIREIYADYLDLLELAGYFRPGKLFNYLESLPPE